MQRQERWEPIAAAAAEQSGRLTVPAIGEAQAIAGLAERAVGAILVCHPGGEPIVSACQTRSDAGAFAIAIGPEGGLSDAEIAILTGAGARLVSLGPGILRTETAAVVATAIVRAAFEAQRIAT
jgi:16S rRNA (uracil1498-N3)-methyltransferase